MKHMELFNSLHPLGVNQHPVAAAFIVVIQPSITAYHTLEHCANNPNSSILSVSRAAWAVVHKLAIMVLLGFLTTTCCNISLYLGVA